MALSDDQKAMLRLLAQREEGYEDMAALMGISVEELRARIKEALSEVEEPEEPTDAAVAASPPAPQAAPTEPASPAPAEPTPSPPVRTATPPPPSPPAAPASPRPSRPSLLGRLRGSENRGALIGIGAGALALIALVIVLIVAGDGGGSSSSSTAGGTSPASAEEKALTQAVLEPTNGSDASGRALFGRYKKEVLLQVQAEGLEPSPAGKTYTIWLYRSPKLVLRLGAVKVGGNGKLAVQLPVPAQVLAYVASGAFDQVDVSLTSNAAYRVELAKARKAQRLPKYTGESVLRGEITGPAIQKQK
jgi:hypothetical protein